jgi:ribosomal protein L12E/L44/L45/RPP1/RPP2
MTCEPFTCVRIVESSQHNKGAGMRNEEEQAEEDEEDEEDEDEEAQHCPESTLFKLAPNVDAIDS